MIDSVKTLLPPMPTAGKGDAALRGIPPPPGFRDGTAAATAGRPAFTVPTATKPADAPAEAPETAARAAGTDSPERKKLKEATEAFEAFFVSYLMKQMRKSVGEGGGFMAPSEGEKIFRDLMDDETARQMSTTGQMGIADLLYRELGPALKRGAEEERP